MKKIAITAGIIGLLVTPVSALALARPITVTDTAAGQAQKLATVQNRGNAEIARRLKTLENLTNRINASAKLSSADKTTLIGEVTDTISGLKALQLQLDAETTLAGARTDAQNILDEYRVYALVVPKIALISAADRQQVIETKLTDLAGKLQNRLNAAQTAGKNVASLQTTLSDMTKQIAAAEAISSAVETAVLPLQPGDYNSDHALLGGYFSQLATAHQDNQAAYKDAQTIVTGLKGL